MDLHDELDGLRLLIDAHESRINDQEQLFAALTMAYVEMFAAVDLLVKTVVQGFPTDQEREEFLKTFDSFRTEVLKSVQEASRSGFEGIDPESVRTMEDMAKRA